MNINKVKEAIVSRRTIHQYKKESLPRSILNEALGVALFAPNHRLTWPWKFFIMGPQSRKKFADILLENKLKKNSSELSDTAKENMRNKFLHPAEAILFGIIKNNDHAIHRENYASLACAIQNISLFLHSEGYGSKWSSGSFEKNKAVFDIIGESEQNIELSGVLWIGRAQTVPTTPIRPPLETFVKTLD